MYPKNAKPRFLKIISPKKSFSWRIFLLQTSMNKVSLAVYIYILPLFGPRTKYFLMSRKYSSNAELKSNNIGYTCFSECTPQKYQAPFFLNNIPQRNPFPGESSSCLAFVNSFARRSVSLAIYILPLFGPRTKYQEYIERDGLDKIAEHDAVHADINIFLS